MYDPQFYYPPGEFKPEYRETRDILSGLEYKRPERIDNSKALTADLKLPQSTYSKDITVYDPQFYYPPGEFKPEYRETIDILSGLEYKRPERRDNSKALTADLILPQSTWSDFPKQEVLQEQKDYNKVFSKPIDITKDFRPLYGPENIEYIQNNVPLRQFIKYRELKNKPILEKINEKEIELSKLIDNGKYFEKEIQDEIKIKGETKKLLHVKNVRKYEFNRLIKDKKNEIQDLRKKLEYSPFATITIPSHIDKNTNKQVDKITMPLKKYFEKRGQILSSFKYKGEYLGRGITTYTDHTPEDTFMVNIPEYESKNNYIEEIISLAKPIISNEPQSLEQILNSIKDVDSIKVSKQINEENKLIPLSEYIKEEDTNKKFYIVAGLGIPIVGGGGYLLQNYIANILWNLVLQPMFIPQLPVAGIRR